MKDFEPVALLPSVPYWLVARKNLPPKDLRELVEWLKANADKATAATTGAGSASHICSLYFQSATGTKFQLVPYRGGAPALQDMLAGQVDMMFDNIPGPLAQVKAGKLRPLAVTSVERSPIAPDVPTMSEYLPGFHITSWGGLCGPAGLPPAMVEKAAALTKKALASSALKTAFPAQGATPMWMSPADTAAFRRAEEKQLAPVIKASGARVD